MSGTPSKLSTPATATQQTPSSPVPAKPQVTTIDIAKDVIGDVQSRLDVLQKSGQLKLPPDYSADNSMLAAQLILVDLKNNLDQPVLSVCTRPSIANALLKMVISGLSPLKNQGYFIPYGDKLNWQPSYSGNIALAKRYGNLKSIAANVVYEGDEFEYAVNPATGRKMIVKHLPKIQNIDNNKILGAYAITELNDGTRDVEVMTILQMRTAWEQGSQKGKGFHEKFTDQACIKTVCNRAVKLLISSSDDGALFDDDAGTEDERLRSTDVAKLMAKESARPEESRPTQPVQEIIIEANPAGPQPKTDPFS